MRRDVGSMTYGELCLAAARAQEAADRLAEAEEATALFLAEPDAAIQLRRLWPGCFVLYLKWGRRSVHVWRRGWRIAVERDYAEEAVHAA